MALIECTFYSETLATTTSMTVILPQQSAVLDAAGIKLEERLPVLYLFHGHGGDATSWQRLTGIERYAGERGIAVVMPQVMNSFYTDMAQGSRYWTFISEELPRVARTFFPLSDSREHNFVAGLSMGGYGAFKWALRQPERFAAAASMSGALDVCSASLKELEGFHLVFGEAGARGTDDDLFALLERQGNGRGDLPKLYQCCGTEDFLHADNLAFRDACRKTRLDLTYTEGPGDHNWAYWDARIQDVLAWLPIRTGK